MSQRRDRMYATIIGVALAVIAVFTVLAVVRVIFGSAEDTWICSKGEWIRHGNPSADKPAVECPQ